MGRSPWLFATLVAWSTTMFAQQPVDRYSIPARSTYNLQSFAGKRPLTRAERTNFAETSHYEDVVAFIDSLKLLGARIATGSIGRTIEGRELPYVIASRPLVSTPAEARRLNRPIAYIQANIHAGEVEGKEAMQSMLRDLLFDKRPNVLDSIVLIVQPIYNADGNEKWGPQARNRGAQNGPELVGTRQNASGWNLNRDYIDADAPETRGALAMFNAWNPDLFMDLHTTDGSIHGYDLTYSPPLTPAAVNVVPYATKMLAEIRRRMLQRDGFYVNDYGDFSRPGVPRPPRGVRGPSLEQIIADSIPTAGWAFSTYESLARYGTNYYGLRNRLGILSEAFSHDPFARRVASTYAFVSEILSYLAEHRAEIMALGREGDAKVAAWARSPGTSPRLALRSRMDTTRIEDVRVEQIAPLADSTKREAGMGNRQRTGIVKLVAMPVMASFTPTLTSTLPFAYAFDSVAARALLPILAVHGIQVERLDVPANAAVQEFTVDSVLDRGRSETSRMLKDVTGRWSAAAKRVLPAGTYVVHAGQPRGLAAFYLLEPESEDGLMQWSFYDGIVASHAPFPVARITAPATLHSHVVRN
jgi:hypothetical protein